MKTLHFSTLIAAPRSVVWQTMLDKESYQAWTRVFAEGSTYEGTWNTGDRIRFLAPNGNGITSVIAASRPQEHVSIKHLGEIADGVEDTTSERVLAWAPAFENYTFADADGGTQVQVDLDVNADYEQYMADTWPKALAELKRLCEGRQP
jgi:uncharacterized protein YndB with AHSA1/START domain